MEDVGSLAEEAKEKEHYLQSRQGDRIKERELKQLLEDDKVPFSEAILFSSYYYTYMHRAPATVTSLVYGLALVTLPLVPKVKLRAKG